MSPYSKGVQSTRSIFQIFNLIAKYSFQSVSLILDVLDFIDRYDLLGIEPGDICNYQVGCRQPEVTVSRSGAYN